MSERYNTPFFSSSALRYADELSDFSNVKSVALVGGGSNFAEYIIHTLEMLVKLLKCKITTVKVEIKGDERYCTLVTEMGNGETVKKDINSDFFLNLIKDIIRFFDSKKHSFDTNETLEIIRVRDALLKAEKADGEWINV